MIFLLQLPYHSRYAAIMKRKAASPTPSEGEVDIAGALFDELDDTPKTAQSAPDLDFHNLLTNGNDEDGEGDDGDAEYIASRQRSSNRKSSNLQGKLVKKGGGFQAMGVFGRPFA